METVLSTPLTRRTPLGDEVTSRLETDATGQFQREHIEIATPLSLVRERRQLDDNPGRNWERH